MDAQHYAQLKQEITERIATDRVLLDQLRSEIRPLRNEVRPISPRSATALSLVATDSGKNSLQFDPFLLHIVRIVDSNNREYCLEVITPTTSIAELSAKQFNPDGTPCTRLGEMMTYLGVHDLTALSQMIRQTPVGQPTSPSWVYVYQELVEWATLFSLIRHQEFSTDTLLVCNGLLRSTVFAQDLFHKYLRGLQAGIERQWQQNKRRLYLVGVAKQNKVLSRYRLAMALEGILTTKYATYVPIPREIEEKAYRWSEYMRGDDRAAEESTQHVFAGGKMFFVKFGKGPRDPIWPVDIFLPQVNEAAQILGYMVTDANNGFPIPYYPQCLQKAHEHAALVDFDVALFQDHVFAGIRQILGHEAPILDTFRLQANEPSQRQYE